MANPTSKTLAQLLAQEKNLEQKIVRYKGSPRLMSAERITEQQIKAKGGQPAKENPRLAAIKRRMQRGQSAASG